MNNTIDERVKKLENSKNYQEEIKVLSDRISFLEYLIETKLGYYIKNRKY